MIPLAKVLAEARAAFQECKLRFLHPSLYLICVDADFSQLDDDERRRSFLRKTGLQADDLEATLVATGVTLCLVASSEIQTELSFIEASPVSHHWLEFLANREATSTGTSTSGRPIIHFYGFKGGQARSTVLAMTAQLLANDGYRVLAIDADIEAPSLPSVFDSQVSNLNATLFGCAQFDLTPVPQAVFVSRLPGGSIDIMACRPSDIDYDLDFVAFALRTTLDPTVIQNVFGAVIDVASGYDVILVDHRSGLSTTVLPVAASFPGPVVICLRLDEQSERTDSFFDVLFRQNKNIPGLFVSFSLDPEENRERMLGKHQSRIEQMLATLGRCIAKGADSDGGDEGNVVVEPEELLEYWVPWFLDRSFLSKRMPLIEAVSGDNQKSLGRIRELLGLSGSKSQPSATFPPLIASGEAAQLTSSGNTDQGLLIETEALRKLRLTNAPYTYVLGRKGTGKTRLLRALVESGLGEPMLVADDFPRPEGIVSSDPLLKDLAATIGVNDTEKFWWVLLDSKLGAPDRASQTSRLQKWLERIRAQGVLAVSISEIARSVEKLQTFRVFLIDGVETAFSSAHIGSFVEGLFRFLSAVQSNVQISQCITVRLFIRTDLARRSIENVEQQIEGRNLQLSWDTQAIFNFVLSRIAGQSWFRKNFDVAVAEIESHTQKLASGALGEDICSAILLKIFPDQIRRSNLRTITFLKTYFSDGVGETTSFYPRIYDTFLQFIADPGRFDRTQARLPQIEVGRVAQTLIIGGHDHAARDYLQQVAAELKNLLSLVPEPEQNKIRVDSLIEGFRGLPTPFELDKCVNTLVGRLENVEALRIREALQQMKQVGIFEDRPDYAGWWRVGRLFKSSLGMKYLRV